MKGIYSDQAAARYKKDTDSFEQSLVRLASVVVGHKEQAENFLSDRETAKNAIGEILKFFHIVPYELPEEISGISEQLDYFLRPSGIMRRRVELTGKWYKDCAGPLLGQTKNGRAAALLPGKVSGYTFFDYEQGKRVKITKENYKLIDIDAFCFYNPLPAKKLAVKDLIFFMIRSLSGPDYGMLTMVTLSAILLGMLTPYANKLLFDNVVASGSIPALMGVASLLIGAAVSTTLIGMTKSLIMERINTKVDISVQSAAMSRLLSLPASFFSAYSSGEISQRLGSLNSLCSTLVQIVLGTGLTSLFSLIYIGQIAATVPVMTIPALFVILVNLMFTFLSSLLSIKTTRQRMETGAKLSGFVFSLFSGVQKIKLAGAERRAFSKWAEQYAKKAELTFSPPWIIKFTPVISSAISCIGTVILYAAAGGYKLSPADYMAFGVSYGMVSAAVAALAGISHNFSTVRAVLEMSRPLMETEPEVSFGKKMLTRLSGALEVNNVSFRYNEDMPLVLDNLSLKIKSGQYVAIVGASGCGKSTLLRLLLGFEQPQKGAIYYDGRDIKAVDTKSLRRSIGCVIQNGRLMSGSIYHNIILSAPHLSLDEAWEAAEMAGIAEDIRAMPMNMHTVVTEGGGGLSGGQRQRLLIARAIALKPKILMLDEATSALDNITQKHVSDSLNKLKCTRLVIAHRLSTIRQCDRIIMLENGKIIEDGTFDQLTKRGGKFAELVERQRLEG